jgi:L-rhamnose mutarotase
MKMHTRAIGALLGIVSFVSLSTAARAADRPYTEGPVLTVSSVRTEPGMFDEYMKYLAGPYKQLMEEQKKAGIIVDYAFYVTSPRGPNDPDLYLVTTYKNMAAMDGLDDRSDAIQEKIFGNQQQQSAATIGRGKMRTLVGEETMRQVILK